MEQRTLEELRNDPALREGHTAWRRGYVSRKTPGYCEPYKGRFGEGFVWHSPSWKSTQYHLVTYFLAR